MCFIKKNGQRRYKYLVLGRDSSYFVKYYSDSIKKFSESDIINMLEFLIDNIFVVFGGRSFPICICDILYFKLNGKYAINEITKPNII
jgi:hypothetical protein